MGRRSILHLCSLVLVSCATVGTSHKDDVLEANRRYDLALVTADAAMLDRIYSDDFVYIGGTKAERRSKQRQIEVMTGGTVKLIEGKSENVEILHLSDTAVLTGEFVGRVRIEGKESSFRERYSTAWRREQGGWRLLLEHGSMMEERPDTSPSSDKPR